MERWSGSLWKLPALSGVLLGLSYYVPVVVLNFLAFVPLLYWLERHDGAARYTLLRGGIVMGLAAHLFTTHFLLALVRFSWLAVLLYLGVALALALKVSIVVGLLGRMRGRTGLPWSWLLLVCWLPLEWLLTFGDLRLTADHLYHGMTAYPFLIQFADLVGPYGVSAFVLAVNGLIYESLLRPGRPGGRRAAIALLLVLIPVLGYDAWAWRCGWDSGSTVRVAVVQPNIPLLDKWSDSTAIEQWNKLRDLTRSAAEQGAELVVWPETARPWTLYHWLDRPETYAVDEVQALARQLGVSVLFGVEYARVRAEDDWQLYNAAMFVDARGRLDPTWVAKVYLVPFTEQLPFRGLFGPLVEGRGGEWRWIAGSFSPGPAATVLATDHGKIGALVCYEQLFPDLSRGLRNAGAELQVVITNDAWFGRTWFQRFQANAVRLRAIENRTAFVRAANTGISGFVDPRGGFHGATPLYEKAVVLADLPLTSTTTIYDRTGDLAARIAVLGLFATVIAAYRRKRP